MLLLNSICRSRLEIAVSLLMCLCPDAVSAQEGPAAGLAVPRIGTRTDVLGDPLPEGALLRLGTKRFQHPSGPSQIILSRDESVVLSIDEDDLIAWDSANGKQLWRKPMEFKGGIRVSAAGYGIRPMAITPDDGTLVTPAGRGSIAYWDVANGESTLVEVDAITSPKSIHVSPEGTLLALGTNQMLLVCDRQGREVFRKENPDQPLAQRVNHQDRMMFGGDFSYGMFSPDGSLLALVNSSKPKTIQLFEATTGEEVRIINGTDRIVRMAFSPDSKRLAATERDISARLYDVQTGEELWEFTIVPPNAAESYTSDIAFRPDGKQIAVGAPIGSDNRIRLLDAASGKETGDLTGSQWKPWTLQYQADSTILYGSGWDGVIRKWDLTSERQMPPPGGVRASGVCATSRDGKHLAFADDRQQLHIADVKSGVSLKTFDAAGIAWGQVVFSHDGTRLAAGGSKDLEVHIFVWDLATQAELHHWKWNKGRDTHSDVEALCFSENGERIAAAVFRQDAAYVWDLPSDRQIARLKHVDVYGLDLDATGHTIVTAGWDKAIRIWDCQIGRELTSLTVEDNGEDTRMYGVKISNDQSMIATVDMANAIRIYDRDLNPISTIQDAGWFTYGTLQFSHNDLWIAAGSGRGVEVYDIESGLKLWAAMEHEEYVYTVDFGARDRSILSGGTDGVCYVWDLQSDPTNELAGDAPLDDEQLYEQLIGSHGVRSFLAYQRLLESPERAVALLSARLDGIATRDVSNTDVRRWIVALGADDDAIVERATKQLIAWGPAADEQLAEALSSSSISTEKKSRVERIRRAISVGNRRITTLLSELDCPAADTAIRDLLMKVDSDELKGLLKKAQTRREGRGS